MLGNPFFNFLPREGEGDRIAGVSEANGAIWWRG